MGGVEGPADSLYARLPLLLSSAKVTVLRIEYRKPNDFEECVLDALAGHSADREALATVGPDVVVTNPDRRSPTNDALLLDADDEQEAVIAAIAAGRSFTVATLPGTGGTQTIINVMIVICNRVGQITNLRLN